MGGRAVPWQQAWYDALYGPHGFYRSPGGPAAHFTTATHGPTGAVLAQALLRYADSHGLDGVVDVGAGRGELLAHLRTLDPDRPLVGVDVVPAPVDLPGGVDWLTSPGGHALPDVLAPHDALVVAHEWLDVVPCPVGEVDPAGVLRIVLVDPETGAESLGDTFPDALPEPDLAWCQRYWPSVTTVDATPGSRVEVGRPRDEAWCGLLDRMTGGIAVAVDYGHTVGERPRHGSLMAYMNGVVVPAVPDGSCDLTAHVAVDSLPHDEILSQREALRALGVTGRTPEHTRARTDPGGYLAGLTRAGAEATLLAPSGFGGFSWVVRDLRGTDAAGGDER